MKNYAEIKEKILEKLKGIKQQSKLAELKAEIFGKTGIITELMKNLRELPNELKPSAGKEINDIRGELLSACNQKEEELHKNAINEKLNADSLDLTIDKPYSVTGSSHPITIIKNRLVDYFVNRGYIVYDSPEVERDYYNFQALNIPQDHPSRDMQDTFFINDNILLRSQTSAGQIRLMEQKKPPLKMICPGRVFRADDDSTHSPVFHQLEGLVIDKNITLCDLKGTLEDFAKFMFGDKTTIRFRPSYFPFTEPSVEVDASCFNCHGKGCRVCKNTGWIELLGAGMVNHKVLRGCNIDPDEYQGFAFGIGLDRTAMVLCGIKDIKLLWDNDVRFLHMFK